MLFPFHSCHHVADAGSEIHWRAIIDPLESSSFACAYMPPSANPPLVTKMFRVFVAPLLAVAVRVAVWLVPPAGAEIVDTVTLFFPPFHQSSRLTRRTGVPPRLTVAYPPLADGLAFAMAIVAVFVAPLLAVAVTVVDVTTVLAAAAGAVMLSTVTALAALLKFTVAPLR